MLALPLIGSSPSIVNGAARESQCQTMLLSKQLVFKKSAEQDHDNFVVNYIFFVSYYSVTLIWFFLEPTKNYNVQV